MIFLLGLEGNLKANKGYASKSYCLKLEDNPAYSMNFLTEEQKQARL